MSTHNQGTQQRLDFRFVGRCDTCEPRVVESAKQCKRGVTVVRELGRGDVGVAYEIEPGSQSNSIQSALSKNGKYVLKEVLIKSEKDMQQFSNEICIGKYLGNLGIAPRIYDCWVCSANAKDSVKTSIKYPVIGYYVMDKMDKIWEHEYPCDSTKLGSGSDNRKAQRAPLAMEKKLVKVLETMVKAGIIHQDCHPGNIGILHNGRVVLFDFGFSIFSLEKITQPETVLMSQLYIVIEQFDKALMYESYLYDVIYKIRQNQYKIN